MQEVSGKVQRAFSHSLIHFCPVPAMEMRGVCNRRESREMLGAGVGGASPWDQCLQIPKGAACNGATWGNLFCWEMHLFYGLPWELLRFRRSPWCCASQHEPHTSHSCASGIYPAQGGKRSSEKLPKCLHSW